MEAEIYEEPLRDVYFDWLYSKVKANGQYTILCRKLFSIEFTYIVRGDVDRLNDGRELRAIFEDEYELPQCCLDMELSTFCSVLEMLIALAERIDQDVMYEADKGNRTADWFYRMVNNLGLSWCTDDNFNEETDKFIDEKVTKWLKRDINFDGKGGIFPLKKCDKNQKSVTIWYQMQKFLMENFPI